MTTLFRLDASIRDAGSVTRALANDMQAVLPEMEIVRRDVGLSPLPPTAWAGAVFGPHTPAGQLQPHQQDGIDLARTLADELIGADAFIFAIPLYNFGVSQHFKTWLDIVLAEPRLAPGSAGLLKGRPAQLIVSRGGGYGEGTPRHGWDHATGWYRRVLADVLLLDTEVIECELTLADVTPSMEGLRAQAAQNLAAAHHAAREHGRKLAARLAGKAAA